MRKQLTTEEMRRLLEDHPTMSPASRHALITGQCPFVDADGTEYQAPLTHVDKGPTHYARLALIEIDGKETHLCNN